MTERNDLPGTGWGNPAGPDRRPEGAAGVLDHVKNTWQTPGGKLLAVVPAVIALIVGSVLGTAFGGGSKNTNTLTPGPTSFVTTTATTTATAGGAAPSSTASSPSGAAPSGTAPGTPSGTTPSGTTPSPNSTQVNTVPLVDLAPAGGAWQSRLSNPMINGALQQFAIVQDVPQENANGDVGYNLGRDYTKLTGLLGLDDDSAKSAMHPSVEIDGDGVKLAAYTPTLGHPAQVSLNVSGVLRLDIKYTSLDSDGLATTGTSLILGDGQLTTVPGYHPPAPSSS